MLSKAKSTVSNRASRTLERLEARPRRHPRPDGNKRNKNPLHRALSDLFLSKTNSKAGPPTMNVAQRNPPRETPPNCTVKIKNEDRVIIEILSDDDDEDSGVEIVPANAVPKVKLPGPNAQPHNLPDPNSNPNPNPLFPLQLDSDNEEAGFGYDDMAFEELNSMQRAADNLGHIRPNLEDNLRAGQQGVELFDGMDDLPLARGAQMAGAFGAMNDATAPIPGLDPFVNWGDYFDLENDEQVNRALLEEFAQARPSQVQAGSVLRPAAQLSPVPQQDIQPSVETRILCIDKVLNIFPDICRDHVSGLYDSISPSSDHLIAHILDRMDQGAHYPKAKQVQSTLKRKREVDEDEVAARKYGSADRAVQITSQMQTILKQILALEFPDVPIAFIEPTLQSAGWRLFSAYPIIEEAQRTHDPKRRALFSKLKTPRKMPVEYREENLNAHIESIRALEPWKADFLEELKAARKIRRKADARRRAEREAELEEEANIARAEAEGTMQDCGCCCVEYPLNRMVHCDNEEALHWFCRNCARNYAETEIGNSKYQLNCMSMEGCEAGFANDQRIQFLDEKTIIALERNEQEAVLRMAGIENLASCPFCPFAAEYPPVEVDREFRCQAPDCEKVSCRLCKLESHIPKSCEENAKENGLSARRQIEEAMSAALIRKCNKCGTPFVKEEGCNKMTCTRNGCYNVQCYICSKSCSYDHFDDKTRGGKPGNCPLFDNVEVRHDAEVKKAEQDALDKVRAEHPEYTEEDLKVKVSEDVLKDEERKKVRIPGHPLHAIRANRLHIALPEIGENDAQRQARLRAFIERERARLDPDFLAGLNRPGMAPGAQDPLLAPRPLFDGPRRNPGGPVELNPPAAPGPPVWPFPARQAQNAPGPGAVPAVNPPQSAPQVPLAALPRRLFDGLLQRRIQNAAGNAAPQPAVVMEPIAERYDVDQRLAELDRGHNLFMPRQRQMPAVNPALDQRARQLDAELVQAQAQDRRQRHQDHQQILAQQIRDRINHLRQHVIQDHQDRAAAQPLQPRAPVPPAPIVAVRAAAPAPAPAAAVVDRQEMLQIIGHAERRRREQHMDQLLRAQQDENAAIDAAIQSFRRNFPRRPQNPNPQP